MTPAVWILVLSAVCAAAMYLLIVTKFSYLFRIRVKTIQLLPPSEGKRIPVKPDDLTLKLISSESTLRRFAYKHVKITTDESFYDDTDMQSNYFLVVVYDKKTNAPLLSSRHYFHKPFIKKQLNGSGKANQHSLNPDIFADGKIFLADRLSGNTANSLYRKYRDYIFFLYYSEILKRNKNCNLILMARSEPQEKLLSKYVRIGFNIMGSAEHKGRKHWIVLADLGKSYSYMRITMLSFGLLHLKHTFTRLFK